MVFIWKRMCKFAALGIVEKRAGFSDDNTCRTITQSDVNKIGF